MAEAADSFRAALALDGALPDASCGLGDALFQLGDLEGSVASYQHALERRPDNAPTHFRLGNALHAAGRNEEALESYRRAVHLHPAMYEAHYNLAVVLLELRPHSKLEEAASSLRRAAEIRPDFAQAHHLLGTVLRRLDQPDAAEASLRRALSIDPDSADTLYALATVVLSRGRAPEAVPLIVSALERAPTSRAKETFVECAGRTTFTKSDPRIRAILTTAIVEAWGMPYALCPPALSLIMLDSTIADCVRRANGSWPTRLPKAALFGADGLGALAGDTLLRAVLESTPLATIEFERFLTCARHALLETASSKRGPRPSDITAVPFYSALAQQCFINEYIFDREDWELEAAEACRTKLLSLLQAKAVLPQFLVLAVAAYFPLCSLREPSRLLAGEPGPIDKVLRQQVIEPLEERALRAGVPSLTSITAGVSEEVRAQYEQNPYPRLVKLPRCEEALPFNDELRRVLPYARFTPLQDNGALELLVAGCGTGSHSILAAQRYRGVRVLAIDLSLSSISYAKRRTQELRLANVEYAQADILALGGMTRTFDIIESVGVLHHLADPFMGWSTLLARLRPGGFMSIGLYSETGRRHVARAREIIAARGYGSSPDEIRRFRQDLFLDDTSEELKRLTTTADFYSTSACRDLLFHVKEHRLTLGQIESFLAEFGLQFLGFELDSSVLRQYHARFTDDPSAASLRNWTLFEGDNPDTFCGMYHFWIQRPLGR